MHITDQLVLLSILPDFSPGNTCIWRISLIM